MKHLLIILSFLFISCLVTCYNAEAQSSFSVDKWKEYIDNLALDDVTVESVETLYDELSYLVENPFDLNRVTAEQLNKLPFLTDKQIKTIVGYRQKYGQMFSVYELKNVEGLDLNTLELLIPFVYISSPSVENRLVSVDNLLKYGHNELYFRMDKGFQQKKGYTSVSDSILTLYPNRKYLGEDFYNSVRYAYKFDDRIQFGFVAEKDGGEPFFTKRHKGYDYYSVHLLIKDIKWLKTLAVGDYKMAFGQGLVVSNDYSPSRSVILSQADRRNNGFRRHYSTNEYDFFRGVGVTLNYKQIDASLFYSDKYLDANIDSLLITSLKTDGLHRLQRDWDKRNQARMRTLGGNIRYVSENFYLGLTALNYSFGRKLYEPELKPYNLYNFRGRENTNVSVDYLLRRGSVKFYGETAISANGAIAILNGLQIQPTSYASFLLLYRNYDKKYQAFFGNAFGQNSSVQNEEGIYLGMQISSFAYWKLSAYADMFRFPWLKYGVDSPSSGKEYMLQMEHNRGKSNSFSLRYRYKQSEINETVENYIHIGKQDQHRLRFQFIHSLHAWNFRTSLDGVVYKKETSKLSKGWMLGQSISFQPQKGKIKADFYTAYFDTESSSVTISSFERTPLYVYYRPSFYGQGIRFAGTLRYDLSRQLMVTVKLSTSHYFDRDKIGTDLEEIEGSNKTDLNFILRWKF
ncbi:helix-hairpin-helix domain-containing protein [Massilibacteroides sp.]|uniref:helix-hairpin-helix domain-containing protein n=1 Tax=Massilibacteroides sp. TaxID=2034766 RepID=UPI002631D698|nr:helix-hairpin-helix domain-containing protein [Massilibacteroides sp.]MDD4514773.1 helix-hairpin-helix domain-containing protein [Massilibacteroides sp.]